MKKTICGLDCDECGWNGTCAGCRETSGKPMGGDCMIAACCKKNGFAECDAWSEKHSCRPGFCALKQALIAEYNALGISDMDPITDLNALPGTFVNQEYPLPNGGTVHFWEDGKMILGNQVPKKGSDRCYGLAADETYLLLCEYGADGNDPEIVIFKRRTTVS